MSETLDSRHPDSKLIDALGGTAEVARLCAIKQPSVSGWRTNGIPAARRQYLALLRPDVFGPSNRPGAEGNHESEAA